MTKSERPISVQMHIEPENGTCLIYCAHIVIVTVLKWTAPSALLQSVHEILFEFFQLKGAVQIPIELIELLDGFGFKFG
jgi:hypothetical protein